MIKITLPDGSVREYESAAVTGTQIAESIGSGLAKAALAVTVDGVQRDLSDPITKDAAVSIITIDSEEGLEIMRHTVAAQVLARAVKNLYPKAKLAIGPTIDDGFYYDVLFEEPISSEDLPAIEKEMRRIVETHASIRKTLNTKAEALAAFNERGEDYKMEIISDSDQEDDFQLYAQGDTGFIDLCRGPHVPTLKHIGAFKLTKLAGAYWRGDANNEVLTRIYGTAWKNDKDLKAYLERLEQQKLRDHRKIGKEMELFTFYPETIGPGLPIWLPKGTIIRDELEKWAREEEYKEGYERVSTPEITKADLFEQSGHLPYYADDMYAPIDIDGDKYYLKPMNCPFHHHVYVAKPRSYRDLPLRVAEYGKCYRYEKSGGLSGLMRVRGMCMNDAHIYCRFDQAKDEFIKVMHLHARYYRTLGIADEDFRMRLSKPDMDKLDKYVDDPQSWIDALNLIREAMDESGLNYYEAEGEAAFYGPKVDFQIKNAIGVEYTMSTNQLDFLATQRFNLTYTGEDGADHPIYVIHRAPLGTHERFTAFLIEHFAGNFPLWLSPVQVVVTGIVDKHNPHVEKVYERLKLAGLRVEKDLRNEKVNYKIREHMHAKVSMVGVIGDKEAEEDTITIRRLGSNKQTSYKLDDFIKQCQEEIHTRALPPVSDEQQKAA
jgi:threonyl-tRNA synthetase